MVVLGGGEWFGVDSFDVPALVDTVAGAQLGGFGAGQGALFGFGALFKEVCYEGSE